MPRRRLRYHEAAATELAEAAEHYEQAREGLGGEFLAAVDAKINRILDAPDRWLRVGRSRRLVVGRFPYVVVYRQHLDGEIEIVAVAHTSRRQTYWRLR